MQLNGSKEHTCRERKPCFYKRRVASNDTQVRVQRDACHYSEDIDLVLLIWIGAVSYFHAVLDNIISSYSKVCQMSTDLWLWNSLDSVMMGPAMQLKSTQPVKMRHWKNLVQVNGKKKFAFLDARIQRPGFSQPSQKKPSTLNQKGRAWRLSSVSTKGVWGIRSLRMADSQTKMWRWITQLKIVYITQLRCISSVKLCSNRKALCWMANEDNLLSQWESCLPRMTPGDGDSRRVTLTISLGLCHSERYTLLQRGVIEGGERKRERTTSKEWTKL